MMSFVLIYNQTCYHKSGLKGDPVLVSRQQGEFFCRASPGRWQGRGEVTGQEDADSRCVDVCTQGSAHTLGNDHRLAP